MQLSTSFIWLSYFSRRHAAPERAAVIVIRRRRRCGDATRTAIQCAMRVDFTTNCMGWVLWSSCVLLRNAYFLNHIKKPYLDNTNQITRVKRSLQTYIWCGVLRVMIFTARLSHFLLPLKTVECNQLTLIKVGPQHWRYNCVLTGNVFI